MGEIIKMVCHGCGHSWQCKTGCGLNHARLNSVIGFFKDEIQKDILRQTQGQPFPLFSFGYQPAHCEVCHEIVSVPVCRLGKEQTKYIGQCPGCLNEIKEGQLEENLVCPICQSCEFDTCREGSWD